MATTNRESGFDDENVICPRCGKKNCQDFYHPPGIPISAEKPLCTLTVPQILREMAATYEQRNIVYGDNYKNFGKAMDALFPNGININPGEIQQYNKLGLLVQIVSKLGRFCNDGCKHVDSIHDAAVYAAMMEEILQDEPKV